MPSDIKGKIKRGEYFPICCIDFLASLLIFNPNCFDFFSMLRETHKNHNDFSQLKETTMIFVLYPGFSLSAWKEKQGIALADPLPPWAQVLLLEELDIAQYMESAQCVRGSGLYANSVKTGTDTGFNQNAATTPQCELSC